MDHTDQTDHRDRDDRDHGSDRSRQGHEAAAAAAGDPLLAVRAELEAVDELPLDARAGVFSRTHEIVVEELRALELG